jgi:branched-chain amino acid aminotransferase
VNTQTLTAESAVAATRHPNSWVYFNGQFVRYHDARVGLVAHALHHGTACFEGIRAYWNPRREQLFLLQAAAHYDRLHRSARVLHMTLRESTDELVDLTLEVLRRNELRENAYIRPLLFKSGEQITPGMDGIEESFAIYTTPYGKHADSTNGIRCMVSSWRRVSEQSVPLRAKITGVYINSALMKSEAVRHGYDEAISLTMDGHVCEGSVANLFLFKDGAFVTPPVSDDILEGVTRQLLIGLIRNELGIDVVERSIGRSELYTCRELLLCGTGAEVLPVVEVDQRQVGDGMVGPLSRRLMDSYLSAARGDAPAHLDWTLPVWSG